MSRTGAGKPCPHIDRNGRSCPNLAPCELHSRPKNAPWSLGRNSTEQGRERRTVFARDLWTCQRCGHQDRTGRSLDLHHDRPGHAVTLCNDCHCAVDPHARRRASR